MLRVLFTALFSALVATSAQAFCGFYVAKADGKLYNKASKVVFVRDGRNSVITMSSDYRGAPSDFALIVPTPKVLKRDQIRTPKAETVKHLADFTAPRLVEYKDHDPCGPVIVEEAIIVEESASQRAQRAKTLGVRIRAEYAVNNYDILILDASQSDGLVTFLTQEGYKLPEGAETALAGYIKNRMKFFVAKVNLKRHSASNVKELPPLHIAFRASKFMLPIQLGKLNADTAQDALFLFLTRQGRVKVSNYRVGQIPSDINIPIFVEQLAPEFFEAVTNKALKFNTLALEHAWDMAWCDPCAADPLSNQQLAELGVTWLGSENTRGQNVYVNRIRGRYSKNQMPRDLEFRVTRNRTNFQGRYVMHQPFTGKLTCEDGKTYAVRKQRQLREEAVDLAKITGWCVRGIERNIQKTVPGHLW